MSNGPQKPMGYTKPWSSELHCLREVETLRCEASWEVFRSLGCRTKGDCNTPASSSFSFVAGSRHTQLSSATCSCQEELPHQTKAMGPINHRLKLPKLSAKITLFSKLIISSIYYRDEKLTNTGINQDFPKPSPCWGNKYTRTEFQLPNHRVIKEYFKTR